MSTVRDRRKIHLPFILRRAVIGILLVLLLALAVIILVLFRVALALFSSWAVFMPAVLEAVALDGLSKLTDTATSSSALSVFVA